MPIASPFHPRTQALCHSYKWKEWAGYYAVCTYDISPEREYNAIRQACGLLDVTPLYKYDITGPGAATLLSRLMVRNVARQKPGRVSYLCWCDEHGKILDDGTCARLGPEHFRVTSAAPAYFWFQRHLAPYEATIEDTSEGIAALALQGPTSRELLRQITDVDLDALRFFAVTEAGFGNKTRGHLSRTGYTGDLGYEIWVKREDALAVWDLLLAEGKRYGLEPIGLDALDMVRIEAGFILHGVDYYSAHTALNQRQMSTPYELGLGWTVKLKSRDPRFIGMEAIEAEKVAGRRWALVGLDIEWDALEEIYDRHDLPPALPHAAWRTAVPVYRAGRQVGRATSGTWSPILKKNLALATVEVGFEEPGTVLDIEWTVEWSREKVPATVVKTPFFDPPRKKA